MAIFLYILIFLIGLCFGSFINAWLWRTRMSLAIRNTRSECPVCRKKILWYDNVPIFSFIFLKGKCRSCNAGISWQYPVVEVCTGILFLLAAIYHQVDVVGISLLLVRDLAILFFLFCVFLYDLKYQEILDRFTTIPAIILFFLTLLFGSKSAESMGAGIGIGAGFFLIQFLISKGRWVGGGDIRMGFLMGVILGSPLVILALLLAYMGGAIVGIVLILLKQKNMKSEVPFGVFLSAATVITMFYGASILRWYISLIR